MATAKFNISAEAERLARLAAEDEDPPASTFRLIEAMIGSLHAITEAGDTEEAAWLGEIGDRLREFGEQLGTRLRGKQERGDLE